MGTWILRRRMRARCHGAREPTRPAHESNRRLIARALGKRRADGTNSSQCETPSRARKGQERPVDATSEEALGCAA